MKLTAKLVSFLVLCILLLVVVDSYLLVERTKSILYEDTERSMHILGLAVKNLVSDTWRKYGQKQAMEIIQDANIRSQHVKVQWIESKTVLQRYWPQQKPGLIRTVREQKNTRTHVVHAYVPVQLPRGWGVLKISQSLIHLEQQVQTIQNRTIFWIGGIGIIGGLAVFVFGFQVIGRRLQLLIEKVRQIGEGDLLSTIKMGGDDELTELATSLNQMCVQMQNAQTQIQAETQARLEAMDQLRQSDRLRVVGQLASGVAHELGTPLNVISGRASLIYKQLLTQEEVTHSAGIIKQQAEQMTTIIRQLLNFARRRSPQKMQADLWQLLEQVYELLEPIAHKHDVSIHLKKEEVPSVRGLIQANQIQQVMTNLLMNAIQASSPGQTIQMGLTSTCRKLPLKEGPEQLCFCLFVHDEGKGIPEEHLHQVFEPFYTTKDIGEGTGLGLSIAYGIIQEHGGWIEVTSELGKGSQFNVLLPQES